MASLEGLDLSGNKLASGLPGSWELPALANLSLASNALTGTLPAAWGAALRSLQGLDLRGNSLSGPVPGSWYTTGFKSPFVGMLQPGNAQLCGTVFPSPPAYQLLWSQLGAAASPNLVTHVLYGTIGSCAQGTCGQANINSSATNPYDVSWANGAAPADVGAANTNLDVLAAPALGTPVQLPCYTAAPPQYFGADVARLGAAWQSSTAGNATADRPVSTTANPQPPGDCSLTAQAPGWWMVDLQQEVTVQAVAVKVGLQTSGVQVRVGNNMDPALNGLCVAAANATIPAGGSAIYICSKLTVTVGCGSWAEGGGGRLQQHVWAAAGADRDSSGGSGGSNSSGS